MAVLLASGPLSVFVTAIVWFGPINFVTGETPIRGPMGLSLVWATLLDVKFDFFNDVSARHSFLAIPLYNPSPL